MKHFAIWPLAVLLAMLLSCGAMAEVALPGSTDIIEAEAFMGDKAIGVVTLPEGIRRIESRAFADSGVTEITLPASLEYIADDAFDGCSDTLIVRCAVNSAAADYCNEHCFAFESTAPKVGVCLPTNEAVYWVNTSRSIFNRFREAKVEYAVAYAQATPELQVAQIERMIDRKVKVLVVAAVDGEAVTSALAKARKAGITVIAYDRLVYDTDDLDFYLSFSSARIGQLQGEYVRDKCKLDTAADALNIEFFAGEEKDSNAKIFFDAAYAVVEPYLESGKLVCPSGGTTFKAVATKGWITENAYNRMKALLKQNYPDAANGGKKPDIVLCSNDTTAMGVIEALQEAGVKAADMPVITGQDCDLDNVRFIRDGLQSMSIFKDSNTMATRLVEICIGLVNGKQPQTDGSIDNGAKAVSLLRCDPIVVTKSNYKKVLVDSGFYSEADLKG